MGVHPEEDSKVGEGTGDHVTYGSTEGIGDAYLREEETSREHGGCIPLCERLTCRRVLDSFYFMPVGAA